MRRALLCGLLITGAAAVPGARVPFGQAPAAPSIDKLADGIRLAVAGGYLRLEVKTDAVVRVMFSKTQDMRADTMMVVGPGGDALGALNPFRTASAALAAAPVPKWRLTTTSAAAVLTTAKLTVSVDLATGAVRFADPSGAVVLAETPGGHRLTPATVQGEETFHVQQAWQSNADESLYGLGERQEGKLDLKGYDLDLWQRNTFVAMPMVVSSRGYGLLWDNTSYTKFGDIGPFVPVPPEDLSDASGKSGGLTEGTLDANGGLQNAQPVTIVGVGRGFAPPVVAGAGGAAARGGRGAGPVTRVWQGEILAPVTGDYQFQTYSNGDIKVTLDGTRRIDHYKQSWATENDQFKIHLEGGTRHPITIALGNGATTLRFAWKTPDPVADTALWSEVGDGIDYYFMYGPAIDQVIAGFRTLTGRASLLPAWAYGFWQSKNKYNTEDEVLATLAEFRSRQIPIDAIVQDWQYWAPDAWGDHQFEASRYPTPDQMIKTIHDEHAHFMISVWGKFYPATENFKALNAIHGVYLTTLTDGIRDWLQRPYVFYDAFSAPARKMFWDQVNGALFSKGVDAWWMDATEPDLVQPSPPTLESLRHDIDQTASGTASRVMNAYPLMNSEAVYDGQRAAAPNQRVFILTRAGFPGIQRYGTVTWSGDITSTWATLRKQITAGLDFSITGDPYWTTDTGGYTMDSRFAGARSGEALDEWQELNARWFQYSTFCPILRVHGTDRPREMWNLGDATTPVYQSELKYDQLRHAMFPYIYSVAGSVTEDGYTLMRPLVMDFSADATAREVTDEFMFGPALLVGPVTEYQARSRPVYLPSGTSWYDFWTGQSTAGGQSITAAAPYDRIPLFVRAGAIVPFGPAQEFVGQTDAKTLTVYVYAGANGAFSLYEDDGATNGYERHEFSEIPFTWTDRTRTLTIGKRAGSFVGMVPTRTFDVVLVSATAPVGYTPAPGNPKAVRYAGNEVKVPF